MNTAQRNYALTRISNIASSARLKLVEKVTIKATKVTWAEAYKKYFEGELELNYEKLLEVDHASSLYPDDVFLLKDMPGYVARQHIPDEGIKALAAFDAKVTFIKDNLMLGDADEALKAIAEFEASL